MELRGEPGGHKATGAGRHRCWMVFIILHCRCPARRAHVRRFIESCLKSKTEEERGETQQGQGRTDRGNKRETQTERQKRDYTETWIETEEDREKRDIQQSYRKTGNKEWEKDIEWNKKRHRIALPPSKWKTSNRSGWESCTLWGYSLCISISYSSQTDNPALCSQGQEGHTLPRATTTHTHTNTVIEFIQHTLRHSYAQTDPNTLAHADTNTHWHTQRHANASMKNLAKLKNGSCCCWSKLKVIHVWVFPWVCSSGNDEWIHWDWLNIQKRGFPWWDNVLYIHLNR